MPTRTFDLDGHQVTAQAVTYNVSVLGVEAPEDLRRAFSVQVKLVDAEGDRWKVVYFDAHRADRSGRLTWDRRGAGKRWEQAHTFGLDEALVIAAKAIFRLKVNGVKVTDVPERRV